MKAIGRMRSSIAWLKNPQAFAPGTAMAFPGVADDKKRAAIIAFLRTNAETPVPLPEPAAATPPAAPAAEAAPKRHHPRHRPRRQQRLRRKPHRRLRPRRRRLRRQRRLRLRLRHRHLRPPRHRHPRLRHRRLRPRRLRLRRLKHRHLRQPRRRHLRLRHRACRRDPGAVGGNARASGSGGARGHRARRPQADRESHRRDGGQSPVAVFDRRAALPQSAAAGLSGREARGRRIGVGIRRATRPT